jgi:hypothetical protein
MTIYFVDQQAFLFKKNAKKAGSFITFEAEENFIYRALASSLIVDGEDYIQKNPEIETLLLNAEEITSEEFLINFNLLEKKQEIQNPEVQEIEEWINTEPQQEIKPDNNFENILKEMNDRLKALEEENKTLKQKNIISFDDQIKILESKNKALDRINLYNKAMTNIAQVEDFISKNNKEELFEEKIFLTLKDEASVIGTAFKSSNKLIIAEFINFIKGKISGQIERLKFEIENM